MRIWDDRRGIILDEKEDCYGGVVEQEILNPLVDDTVVVWYTKDDMYASPNSTVRQILIKQVVDTFLIFTR